MRQLLAAMRVTRRVDQIDGGRAGMLGEALEARIQRIETSRRPGGESQRCANLRVIGEHERQRAVAIELAAKHGSAQDRIAFHTSFDLLAFDARSDLASDQGTDHCNERHDQRVAEDSSLVLAEGHDNALALAASHGCADDRTTHDRRVRQSTQMRRQ